MKRTSDTPGESYRPGEDLGELGPREDEGRELLERGAREQPRGVGGLEPSPDQVLSGRTSYGPFGAQQDRTESMERPSPGGQAIAGHGTLGGPQGAEEVNPDDID